ncbi:hypothetical protein LB507_011539 [Fusarium sp. FIESC RH6]|nr:hypothetical protein LB507_011539 [Fusarium sp. FIESC RH6]
MEEDDLNVPLGNTVKRRGKSIASLLEEIEEHQLPAVKCLSFIWQLECLQAHRNPRKKLRLIRDKINAFKEKDFVALSYTWDNSEHENPEKGKYLVQTRDERRRFLPSPVRDCVLDRVLSFMRARNLRNLWIDKHCVRQWTCTATDSCNHTRCKEKQRALETMDLVYSQSNHPVSLLGTPIEWEHELDLLNGIVSGKLTEELKTTEHDEVLQALDLLSRITNDHWWTRGWIFQESYRGRKRMTLLIRHPPFLEAKKQYYGRFSNVPNEICINAARFSKTSTRLCLAIRDELPRDDVLYRTEQILGAVGAYTILLERTMPMSPTVIDDIQRRRLDKPWDKLAIIANCCQYDTLINYKQMEKPKSLSISTLAMYILNGEILKNEPLKNRSSLLEETLSQFLKKQAFDGFRPPTSQPDLTFNKGCRFIDVKITPIGIKTKGHLWKLGRIIDTSRFRLPLPEAQGKLCSLDEDEQQHLAWLVAELKSLNEATLAQHIQNFFSYDRTRPFEYSGKETFSRWYMGIMAEGLVAAIKKGSLLRLARIWSSQRNDNPCTAVFIWDADVAKITGLEDKPYRCDHHRRRERRPKFAFTASRPLKRGFQDRGTNDLDHHVSLEVKLSSLVDRPPDDHPQLFIKRWLAGLCFFYDFPMTDVIFPWPSSFHTVNH